MISIQKKIVTSGKKYDGFQVNEIFTAENLILCYALVKSKSFENNTLFLVFDKLLKLIYQHEFHGNIGVPKIINESLYFNGLNSLFVLNEKELIKKFELETYKMQGFAVVSADVIILSKLNENRSREYKCLNLNNGLILWAKSSEDNLLYKGEIGKNFVVSHFLDRRVDSNTGIFSDERYKIQCLNFETGDLVWSHEVQDWFVFNSVSGNVYKNQVRQLVIYKHLVIANMHSHVVAFDIETGKEAWRTDIGLMYINTQYFFILDEIEGTLWVNTSTTNYNNGTLKCINANTGVVLFSATMPWDNNWQQIYPLAIANPNINYGDVWLPHFSMNKNFLFYSFQGGFIGVMSKKTGEIVEWMSFSKRNGVTQMGHKLLNKTLYQATEFELLAIDVSEYFIDGDEYEKNAKDD